VYDVASHLGLRGVAGTHTVGVEVGNGWWNPLPLRFWGHDNIRTALTTGEPMFRLELRLELSDGTKRVINSNPTDWTVSGTPTVFNNIYLGEKYDARLASDAWHAADFDATPTRRAQAGRTNEGLNGTAHGGERRGMGWAAPLVVRSPGRMVVQSAPPIKKVELLPVTKLAPAPPAPAPTPAPPNPTCGQKCMCGEASEPAAGKPLDQGVFATIPLFPSCCFLLVSFLLFLLVVSFFLFPSSYFLLVVSFFLFPSCFLLPACVLLLPSSCLLLPFFVPSAFFVLEVSPLTPGL
jgi:hypothetical protein